MPVIINDFEVVSNGNQTQPAATQAPAAPPAQRAPSARQTARLLQMIKQRAQRLHAD